MEDVFGCSIMLETTKLAKNDLFMAGGLEGMGKVKGRRQKCRKIPLAKSQPITTSSWKGYKQRKAYKDRLMVLQNNVAAVVKIQSFVKMWKTRKAYRARCQYFKDHAAGSAGKSFPRADTSVPPTPQPYESQRNSCFLKGHVVELIILKQEHWLNGKSKAMKMRPEADASHNGGDVLTDLICQAIYELVDEIGLVPMLGLILCQTVTSCYCNEPLKKVRKEKLLKEAIVVSNAEKFQKKSYFQDHEFGIMAIMPSKLFSAEEPPLNVVRKFVHLLDQSALDFEEELEVTRIREEVVTKIRSNQQLEKDLNLMDIKIGLLVKNRITLQ
eukprot:g47830.t1